MAPISQSNGTNGLKEHHVEPYQYNHRVLNTPQPAKIITIGSGVSAIAAVKLFQEHFANRPTQLVVYEKNADVGGTWLENRYPG